MLTPYGERIVMQSEKEKGSKEMVQQNQLWEVKKNNTRFGHHKEKKIIKKKFKDKLLFYSHYLLKSK